MRVLADLPVDRFQAYALQIYRHSIQYNDHHVWSQHLRNIIHMICEDIHVILSGGRPSIRLSKKEFNHTTGFCIKLYMSLLCKQNASLHYGDYKAIFSEQKRKNRDGSDGYIGVLPTIFSKYKI